MRFTLLASTSLALVIYVGRADAQDIFNPIGTSATRPTAISPDGESVVGLITLVSGQISIFRWVEKRNTLFLSLSSSHGEPDAAWGGEPLAHTNVLGNGDEQAALFAHNVGNQNLGALLSKRADSLSSAFGCSADGSVVVGFGWSTPWTRHAFRWNAAEGKVDLGAQAAGGSSHANGVSDDGRVVVGWDEDPSGFRRPTIWKNDVPLWISNLPGEAHDANNDGTIVVGTVQGSAFRWTSETGLIDLGKLAGSQPGDAAVALGVSDDGKTVVGSIETPFGFAPSRASARQLARHRHFTVNGRTVDIPSFQVRPGDVVAVKEKSRNVGIIKETLESRRAGDLDWFTVSEKTMEGRVLRIPDRAAIPTPVQEQLVVELYSK